MFARSYQKIESILAYLVETIDFPQRCDADGITPDGKRIWITNTATIME